MGVALITKFILKFEITILILGKTLDQGRSFENAYFLSSLKHDFSSESFWKILFITFEMNVPILDKMPAHGRSFDSKIHFGIWNDNIDFG